MQVSGIITLSIIDELSQRNLHLSFSSGNENESAFQLRPIKARLLIDLEFVAAVFKPQDGAQIKVCFTRSAYVAMEDNPQNIECHESSGDEIKFFARDPCKSKFLQ
ncbi:hypothetical protein AVEN_55075-1 [Araneus ventricosus]|uniref:Uncharacterized protein n=1 Tax=Araneus ventricosus TaxID=182803 RepID=A0A4Y2X6F3_ARAVE|nr:hypothetical protein AVEN_55075-1 [Araneus ventricosus]